MSALLTQCPHCNTSFRVSAAQQSAANGLVRCGSCLAVFSAADNEIRIKPTVLEPDNDPVPEFDEDFSGAAETTAPAADPPPSALVFTMDTSMNTEDSATTGDDRTAPEDVLPEEPDAPPSDQNTEPAISIEATSPTGPLDLAELETEAFEPDDQDEHKSEHAASATPSTHMDQVPQEQVAIVHADYSDEVNLGDMRIDDLDDVHSLHSGNDEHDDHHATAENDSAAAQQTEAADAPRNAAQEKAHVRDYLSSLEDDEEIQGAVDDTQLDVLDEEPLTFNAPQQRRVGATLLLLSANLLLIAGLILQWAYWNRATLATHPRFSFIAPYACKVFTCPAPAPLPVDSTLSSQQLQVRTHPRIPDALEINFLFSNEGATAQPFPNLELAFSDINNQLLANRLFTPQEYLQPELRQFSEIPPGTSVQVTLELADPGTDAVNYNISFHDP